MRLSCKNCIRLVLVAWLVMINAACNTVPATATPASLTMNFSPALRPFGQVFQTCTRMQPGVSLLVNELSIRQFSSIPADIYLTWGEAPFPGRTPYQTGTEEIVFIVNRENPLTSINASQLDELLSGEASTWGALLQPACEDCPPDSPVHPFADDAVELWTYPAGAEVIQALSTIRGESLLPSYRSYLAPDPEAMRQSIHLSPAGLGFIPRRWLDDSVKLLEVRGLPSGAGRLPILAYPSEPVSPAANAFIACLQQVMNP